MLLLYVAQIIISHPLKQNKDREIMNEFQTHAAEIAEQFTDHMDVSTDEIEQTLQQLVTEWEVPVDEAKRSVTIIYLDKAGISRDELDSSGTEVTLVGDINEDGQWVDIAVKVVELWEPRFDSISQVGLVGDESGRIKFLVFESSKLSKLEKGESYKLQNVVSEKYHGDYSIKLNRTTAITKLDEDIEIDESASDLTNKSGSNQIVAEKNASPIKTTTGGLQKSNEDSRLENDVWREPQSAPNETPPEPIVDVSYNELTEGELIGRGSNADVTKATLSTDTGDVTLALKKPRVSGTLHKDVIERMLSEAETWHKLDDHNNIVGITDYGSNPLPWIAMEYMDGGHLGHQINKMNTAQSIWTAISITEGVYYAHRRGVAHLDLKPENILFRTVDGAWDVPKVADWGLSKHLLDQSQTVEGISPQYAAPEQFDDNYGPVDDITDIYQLGAVFYEMFTGHPPFEGNQMEVMRCVLTDEPTPPSATTNIPKELDPVLMKSLSKEKKDRYDSVILLRNALQKVGIDVFSHE